MQKLRNHLIMKTTPVAPAAATVCGQKFRFTVLTDRLIRLEYQADGIFEDRATQSVVNRVFDLPDFTVREQDGILSIDTKELTLAYQKEQPFEAGTLSAVLKHPFNPRKATWHYGETGGNLGGTGRTLDKYDGDTHIETGSKIKLTDGVCSQFGFAVLDDSRCLVLREDGMVEQRKAACTDAYLFAYDRDYFTAVADYYRLTGVPPMVPRFVLGNWWSRYYKYTQQEYMQLIEKFEEEDIPFSVAIIDMDWHYVDIPKEYGSGWTGYSWNKEFFPDYKAFLKFLHAHHLKTSLNLHPAEGIRAFEDMYPEMCKAMDTDPSEGKPIAFDITSPKFINAYFEVLHHPYEQDGVDFWWMDWQQGSRSAMKGLDPLWMLNHFHTLDIARDGKRPMLFSRFCGYGSQRYPIGFSGDTVISWKSLQYQPRFTATASNIGYSWWSHDIGGHMFGSRDDELYARWIELGVFSPVNRLHSSNSLFTGKEPWKYSPPAEKAARKFLKLRHELLPYLYTANYRNFSELKPMVVPMYWLYPQANEAYKVPNQYGFGSEMVVSPITSPNDPVSKLGKTVAYLPEHIWTDFFTGHVYHGEQMLNVYRTLDNMPVFCKAGAIVPTDIYHAHDNKLENRPDLRLYIFPGADNTFTLYEDEGENNDYLTGKCAKTDYTLKWGEKEASFTVNPVKGDASLIPEERTYELYFRGFNEDVAATVMTDGKEIDCESSYCSACHTLIVKVPAASVHSESVITLHSPTALTYDGRNLAEDCFKMIESTQCSNREKDVIFSIIRKNAPSAQKCVELMRSVSTPYLREALIEIVSQY